METPPITMPGIVRFAVWLTFFNTWVLFEETVVDRSTGPKRFFRLSTPVAPGSALRIDSLSRTRGVTLRFSAVPNRSYTVQYADSPITGPWQKLADVPARPTRHTATVSDPNPGPSRFYRVVTPMLP